MRHDPATGRFLPKGDEGGQPSQAAWDGVAHPKGDGPDKRAPWGRSTDGRPFNSFGAAMPNVAPGGSAISDRSAAARKAWDTRRAQAKAAADKPAGPVGAPASAPADVHEGPDVASGFASAAAYEAFHQGVQDAANGVQSLFPDQHLVFKDEGVNEEKTASFFNVVAAATDPKTSSVYFAPMYATTAGQQDEESQQSADIAEGFHPPGTEGLVGIAAHEFGHVVNLAAADRVLAGDTSFPAAKGLPLRIDPATEESRASLASRLAERAILGAGPANWMHKFALYGDQSPLEGVAEAVAHVSRGGRDPHAVAVVRALGGTVP